MRNTRVKPHIQRVRHFVVLVSIGLQQVGGIQVEPRINATLLDQLGN